MTETERWQMIEIKERIDIEKWEKEVETKVEEKEKFSGIDANGILWVDGIVVTKMEKWNKRTLLTKDQCMKIFEKEIFEQFLFDSCTFAPYVDGMPDDCENLIS